MGEGGTGCTGSDLTKGERMEQKDYSDFAEGPEPDMVSREKVIKLLERSRRERLMPIGWNWLEKLYEDLIDEVRKL